MGSSSALAFNLIIGETVKIGVMLRHANQHGGGVLIYTHNLIREILALNTHHEFVFLYQNPQLVGTYGNGSHVREIAMKAPFSILWDQLAVRLIEKREKFDLIFNPKYSLPLLAQCPTVFVCHGLDWYVMPWGSRWIDRLNHRYLIPRYTRKADAIIAVSNTTRQHVIEYLNVDHARVHTVYLGVDEAFRRSISQNRLDEIRRMYKLPEQFFLYCGQIYPPKNFGRLLRAYAQVGPEMGMFLVVAGEHRWLCEDELALIDQLGLSEWVVRPGWIDHATLPAFYALAKALLLPSLYEACPSPLLEAMSSGCPIVTANRYGTQELADQAGLLVDPENLESIVDGMRRVVTNSDLRQQLIASGRERVHAFTWKRCARETLRVLESVGKLGKSMSGQ
jgi:glycosyltransferase involved in cell wall biosynthesis